jgi:hypothetical protein
MARKERWEIRDAKALRAMAHPLRMRLLEVVGREGAATATLCAQETGESVANCSYHLKTLAKYGYLEEAEGGQGREKPWRLVHAGRSWDTWRMDTEEGVRAAEAADNAFLEYEFELIRERKESQSAEPEEWREAVGGSNTSVYLTATEAAELRQNMWQLLKPFKERNEHRDARPEGARPVHFFLYTSVAPKR